MSSQDSKRLRRLKQKYARKRTTQLEILSRLEQKPLSELVVTLNENEDNVAAQATRFLCVLNAGKTGNVGGVTSEELEATFSQFRGFVGLKMVLGKVQYVAVFETTTKHGPDPCIALDAHTRTPSSRIPL
ncbi:hypothetical protein HDV00_011314 [Rhizophlyctis rosea]|nr:hypothetical protein HDV00_011314 [Rhizophlyctis rosea]